MATKVNATITPAASFLASELYGRGARIGFYLQGVSAAMTLIPVPSSPTAESLNYASQILPIGIMAFAFICSQDALLARHQITFPEALAAFGAVHAALLPSICGMHAKPGRHSTLSLGMTVLSLFLAQIALATSMARDTAGVSIKAGIALLVVSIIYMAAPLAYWIYRLFRVATGRPRLPYIWHLLHWKETMPNTSLPPQYNTVNTSQNNMYDWVRFLFMVLTIVGLGFPIAMTEAAIEDHALSSQKDVFSPGQLAPLALGLVLVVWQLLSMVEQIKSSHRASNGASSYNNDYHEKAWSEAPSSERGLVNGSMRGTGDVERGMGYTGGARSMVGMSEVDEASEYRGMSPSVRGSELGRGRGLESDRQTIRTMRTTRTARSGRSVLSEEGEDAAEPEVTLPVVHRI